MRRHRVSWLAALTCVVSTIFPSLSGDDACADDSTPIVREAWDAIFIAGKKVGYIQTKVEPVTAKDGRELLRVQVQTQLKFKRLNDTATIQTRFGAIETTDGSILRMDYRSETGGAEMRLTGELRDGEMQLSLEGGGKTARLELPWGDDVRGPYGPEQSLSRRPMKPGERREVPTFLLELNQIGKTVLEAKQVEPVKLGGGTTLELLRIDSVVLGSDGSKFPGMDTKYWVDSEGQVLTSLTDLLGGTAAYRTTKEAALAAIESPFDLVRASVVPVTNRLTRPEATRSAVYRLQLTGEDRPEVVFPTDDRQKTEVASDGSIYLRVKTVGPGQADATVAEVAPEFLEASPYLNSEDPEVMALARRAAGKAADPWSKAVAVQDWVSKNIRRKNFEVSRATARDVARTLEGDCTEHAVLAAAMCRTLGIPSRVVIGLLYVDDLRGFGSHMWNEVLINGQWVAIDPTFGQSEVDAVHLKVGDSSLSGVTAEELYLSIVRVFSKLKIEPIEVR